MPGKPIKNEIKLIISFWIARVQSVLLLLCGTKPQRRFKTFNAVRKSSRKTYTYNTIWARRTLEELCFSYLPWIFLKVRIKISLYFAFFGTNTTFPFKSWIRRFYQPLKGQLLLINWAEVTELVAHQQSQRYRLVYQTHRWRKTKETNKQRAYWTITKPEYGLTKQSKTSQRHKENSPATK